MRFEWKTAARQTLIVHVDSSGSVQAELYSPKGHSVAVPAIVLSHLQHWWKAEQVLITVSAMADDQRGKIKQSSVERDSTAPQGIQLRYDTLRRHQQNLQGMTSIRDVALSRALSAADKAMLGGADKVTAPILGVVLAPQQILQPLH